MLNGKLGDIKYHFCAFGITWPGTEYRSTKPLVNTLHNSPIIHKKGGIFIANISKTLLWMIAQSKHIATYFAIMINVFQQLGFI